MTKFYYKDADKSIHFRVIRFQWVRILVIFIIFPIFLYFNKSNIVLYSLILGLVFGYSFISTTLSAYKYSKTFIKSFDINEEHLIIKYFFQNEERCIKLEKNKISVEIKPESGLTDIKKMIINFDNHQLIQYSIIGWKIKEFKEIQNLLNKTNNKTSHNNVYKQ